MAAVYAARRHIEAPPRPLPMGDSMWNYVLRHRLLLRAIYARSTPIVDPTR